MAAYIVGPLFGKYAPSARPWHIEMYFFSGPALGPVVGGVITQKIGFRYIFVILAGLCAVNAAIAIPTLRETYAPVIRLRRCIAQHGDLEKLLDVYPELKRREGSKLGYIWLNITRPLVLLTRSSVCFLLSLYMAFIYGTYYLMVCCPPTFPHLAAEYRFSSPLLRMFMVAFTDSDQLPLVWLIFLWVWVSSSRRLCGANTETPCIER
jgi:MFS family permease